MLLWLPRDGAPLYSTSVCLNSKSKEISNEIMIRIKIVIKENGNSANFAAKPLIKFVYRSKDHLNG